MVRFPRGAQGHGPRGKFFAGHSGQIFALLQIQSLQHSSVIILSDPPPPPLQTIIFCMVMPQILPAHPLNLIKSEWSQTEHNVSVFR